jgi:hypothetical protein
MTYRRARYNTWEEYIHKRYGDKIVDDCKNFVFLKDGSMVYDYDKFDDHIEAMIDAVNNGEDIDRMISIIYREKIDQPIVKEKLLKIMKDGTVK